MTVGSEAKMSKCVHAKLHMLELSMWGRGFMQVLVPSGQCVLNDNSGAEPAPPILLNTCTESVSENRRQQDGIYQHVPGFLDTDFKVSAPGVTSSLAMTVTDTGLHVKACWYLTICTLAGEEVIGTICRSCKGLSINMWP